MVRDRIERNLMTPKDFPERTLIGKSTGKGLIDLYLMKFDMLKHMMTHVLDSIKLPSEVKAMVPRVLGTHKAYSQHLSPVEGARSVDMSWRRDWTNSSIMSLGFLEDVVYGEEYDSQLRNAVRAAKSAKDVMEYDSMALKIADLKRMRQDELDAETKTNLPANSEEKKTDPSDPAQAAMTSENTDSVGKEALRVLDSQIALFVEPESQLELKQAILNSGFRTNFGNETTGCPMWSPPRPQRRLKNKKKWQVCPHHL